MACRTCIVWIIADDMTYADAQYMPFLTSKRSEAADFGAAFCPFPLCGPSRASLLTGQMPHNHGVLANNAPHGGFDALITPDKNIGKWMKSAGYRTGFIADKLINGWDGADMIAGWEDYHVALGYRPGQLRNERKRCHQFLLGPRHLGHRSHARPGDRLRPPVGRGAVLSLSQPASAACRQRPGTAPCRRL